MKAIPKICAFVFIFIIIIFRPAMAESPMEGALIQADQLAKSGQWDASEILYLKAVNSPEVENRIRAYHGLSDLYGRLRMSAKRKRAETQLQDEKTFLEKLVPVDESFYSKYEVKKSDSYSKLAQRFKVSLEWLKRANGSKLLKPGAVILVPKTPFRLEIDKARKKLVWKRGDETLKEYTVTIGGKSSQTPEGEFEIVNKIKDPVWYRLKQQFPAQSPGNMLGTRWMGLNIKGYGIHGTRFAGDIGAAVSHGCVRMRNRDVEEIFDWIPIGTKVAVKNVAV